MAILVSSTYSAPLGTATTYQGRLMDGDSPADGEYDFQFKLYDEPNEAGVQQGSTFNVEDKQVTNGLFMVKLNFGCSVLTGDARWLDIGVRPGAETGAFTTLNAIKELEGRNQLLIEQNQKMSQRLEALERIVQQHQFSSAKKGQQ